MMRTMQTTATVLLLMLTSCASVQVRPVTNQHGSTGINASDRTSGVRFYRPALHVWITRSAPSDKVNVQTDVKSKTTKDTSTAKKEATSVESSTATMTTAGDAYTATFEWLPDYSQEYIITWNAGIGTVNPSFTLTNGWNLTTFNSTVDSKTSQNLSAIASLATAAASALTKANGFDGVGLYRMKFTPTGEMKLGKRVLALE